MDRFPQAYTFIPHLFIRFIFYVVLQIKNSLDNKSVGNKGDKFTLNLLVPLNVIISLHTMPFTSLADIAGSTRPKLA